jgi:hypothetical protein
LSQYSNHENTNDHEEHEENLLRIFCTNLSSSWPSCVRGGCTERKWSPRSPRFTLRQAHATHPAAVCHRRPLVYAQPPEAAHRFQLIAPGVYGAIGTGTLNVGSNSCVIVNRDDVLIVDRKAL